jgi:hypothetical protein
MSPDLSRFVCPRCGEPCTRYSGSKYGRGCEHCYTMLPPAPPLAREDETSRCSLRGRSGG